MTRFVLMMLTALTVLSACPKAPPETIAGSDDATIDSLSNQLEELRTRELKCEDFCALKSKVCGLSGKTCDIAGKNADRADFQKHCVSSQEECARFNESCSPCQK